MTPVVLTVGDLVVRCPTAEDAGPRPAIPPSGRPPTPENRARGLEADKAQVARCDELWFVGGRVTSGMRDEAAAAREVIDLTHLGELPVVYEPEPEDPEC